VEIARRRWRIESGFNAEKNQGYSLGHCFSYNWNAMKAYHHLMKIARFLNTMAARSGLLAEYTVGYGIQGLFQSFRAALSGGGLDEGRIRAAAAARNARWRMAEDDIFLVRGSPKPPHTSVSENPWTLPAARLPDAPAFACASLAAGCPHAPPMAAGACFFADFFLRATLGALILLPISPILHALRLALLSRFSRV
jgi:hypothetical protein